MFGKKEAKLKEEIDVLKQELISLKTLVLNGSIRNKGVQTDIRQTPFRHDITILTTTKKTIKKELTTTQGNKDISAVEVVNLVNDFKESLQRKFKSLTDQEFFIFNVIYALEEQLGAVSYKDISTKIGISESAVRDHTRSIIKKGISLIKEKANNRINFFRISPELKSMISLDSLIQMRSPYKKQKVFV